MNNHLLELIELKQEVDLLIENRIKPHSKLYNRLTNKFNDLTATEIVKLGHASQYLSGGVSSGYVGYKIRKKMDEAILKKLIDMENPTLRDVQRLRDKEKKRVRRYERLASVSDNIWIPTLVGIVVGGTVASTIAAAMVGVGIGLTFSSIPHIGGYILRKKSTKVKNMEKETNELFLKLATEMKNKDIKL